MKSLICSECKHRNRSPQHETIKIDGRTGRTLLGRVIELKASVEVWLCSQCGHATLESVSLPLDPDAPLVAAYEEKFGKANALDLESLAILNTQAIAAIGNDHAEFHDMLMEVVERLRDQLGDKWCDVIVNAGVSFECGTK